MPDALPIRVHLLDVGPEEYADALVCEFRGTTVMIDGAHPSDHRGHEGHPSIPDQLDAIFGAQRPHALDLLIVTHAHQDHIGCLPKLVADDVIRFRWALVSDPELGWGVLPDAGPDADIADGRVRALVAALRDECAPLSPRSSDARVSAFVADAVSLEDTYRTMLGTLRQRGTKIVRIGKDSPTKLQNEFAGVGLRVLGPSKKQAARCAKLIHDLSRDAADSVADMFAGDAALTAAQAYRRLAAGELDALDVSRPGPAVNLQSAVTTFAVGGHKFLFAGDMQFANPQVGDQTVQTEIQALRRRVSAVAPFDLAKLSHHGSDNAFSEAIMSELGGTVLYGICAGAHSSAHPNPATLNLLNQHKHEIRWARTDRNRHVTMTFGPQPPKVDLERGRINDERPNSEDVTTVPAPATRTPARELVAAPVVVSSVAAGDSGVVEVTAKIPHVDTRVVITIEVTPGAANGGGNGAASPASGVGGRTDALRLGGGRKMERLLFVTNEGRLARNIGRDETRAALTAIRQAQMPVCLIPDGVAGVKDAADAVRARLAGSDASGVVVIGGHDVVPLQSVDCLPSSLRSRLGDNDDPDGFVVWSDDIYGDSDGDGLPEYPVSRIPDGKSADLVLKALRAQAPDRIQRAGIRNVARPFAAEVFKGIAGNAGILVSGPAVFDQQPVIDLDSQQIYMMLHGDYVDGTRFWGEDTPGEREAINIGNLPASVRGVVFTGCCWGALTAEVPAGMVVANRPFGTKTPDNSIALAALERGALAFVGCTGAHYSPTVDPYEYFGGPMHRAFWSQYRSGAAPAKALFDAKAEFIAGMPHGRTSAAQSAIEFKILRQYTCLGLGW